ncbi:MAG: hypothetical protein K2X51_04340 [Burkholderiales bacterium]|nr:hypothetical protein [Burkholderiales bacterium]
MSAESATMLQANAFAGVDAVIRCPNIVVMGVMVIPFLLMGVMVIPFLLMGVMVIPFLLCVGRPAAPGVRSCVSGEVILALATGSIVSNALPFVSSQPVVTNAHTVHTHTR